MGYILPFWWHLSNFVGTDSNVGNENLRNQNIVLELIKEICETETEDSFKEKVI